MISSTKKNNSERSSISFRQDHIRVEFASPIITYTTMTQRYTAAGMESTSLDELMSQTTLDPRKESSEDSKKSCLSTAESMAAHHSNETSDSIPIVVGRPLDHVPVDFSKIPAVISLSIWRHAVASIPATVVMLDDFFPENSLFNTCFDSRKCFLERYIVFHHPGLSNTVVHISSPSTTRSILLTCSAIEKKTLSAEPCASTLPQ